MTISSLTDENLLAGYCESGRAELFEELVRRYSSRALIWALPIVGNMHSAEDVFQLSLLKVWRKCRQFRGDSTFRTWFCAIVHRVAIQMRRKVCRERVRLDDLPESAFARSSPVKESDIEFYMSGLTERLRSVVVLVYLEGRRYDEAAAELDIPIGTVRSRLNRAINEMRKAAA